MRKLFAAIVALCCVYFVAGWILVILEWLPQEQYSLYTGLVGAVASLIGLFSFIRPPMSRINLRELEADSLRSIVTMTDEIQRLEEEKTQAKGEIENLDIRNKEMEILVRKASLSLFLKEQLAYHERQVQDITANNVYLSQHLEEVQDIKGKLETLNEDIDSDPNVSLMQDIINTASRREPTEDEVIARLPPTMQLFYLVGRSISSNFGRLLR